MNRQKVNLDDSFEENERRANQMTQQQKNKQIIDNAFSDERIPSALQPRKTGNPSPLFEFEIDERPTRQRAIDHDNQPLPVRTKMNENDYIPRVGKENQRNIINIDENEDTFHNQDQFAKIFARGEKLKQQMDQALDSQNAWETLHGPHHVVKKYIPPFLQEGGEERKSKDFDHIYELEIEGYDLRDSVQEKTNNTNNNNDTFNPQQQKTGMSTQDQGTPHIRDMKFIKVKICNLRVENEELLHHLIDQAFTLTVELPLPDIYQKKVSYQHLKLNNYDILSFNEFAFNNSSLYNFKIDEETFNQLVQSHLKVGIEGFKVQGTLNMIKLLMSKTYKIEVSIPLEQTIEIDDNQQKAKKKQQVDKKKQPQGKAEPPKRKSQKEIVAPPQTFTRQVGHLTIELQLQRGDTEEELARDYQIKLLRLQEQKQKEEQERIAEMQKYIKFSQAQEATFAQLYLNIKSVRNLCLNHDGTLIQKLHDESFNQRIQSQRSREEQKQQENINDDSQILAQKQKLPLAPKRNLFVQYKAFPALEKLKTNTVFQDHEPKFSYRSQFPIVVNPETLEKLQNFTFVLEVWDAVNPSKDEFIGLVKIPLASFCYSMRTTDERVFSTNFLADQHCLYPMMIADGYMPIYSPRLGTNIGELNATLAMGTAVQISRQIQKEQEQEKQMLEIAMQTQIVEIMKQKQMSPIKIQVESPTKAIENQDEVIPDKTESPKGFGRGLFCGFEQENPLMKNIQSFLKQSVNASFQSRDFDMRKLSFINSMRKLFEEARCADIQEINGDEIFRDIVKNYDGTVKKDDFVYSLLNGKYFSLTRTEISNICSLVLNISKDDNNNIDVDELQKCYRSYLTYYDSIETRIKDLLEKFLLSINKKINNEEQQEEFVRQIEEKAVESKIQITELRDIFDNNGIAIRDTLYDQLASYFDLDRNGQIFITSFCEFLRNPSMKNFNFFKVHPIILVNLVSEYIKNEVQIRQDTLNLFENDLKIELHQAQGKSPNLDEISDDFLAQERINTKQFQLSLRKYGIQLTLWELFTLFDHLNTTYAKMYYEPQRYHSITFPMFHKFVTNNDYDVKIKEDQMKRAMQKAIADQLVKASSESVFALAADLNKKKRRDEDSDDEGIFCNKELESDEEVIFSKGTSKNRGKNADKKKDMTFQKREENKSQISALIMEEDNRPFKKLKHTFEIKVKELKNIPILDKLIKDLTINDNTHSHQTQAQNKSKFNKQDQNKYIQNVAVKYSFPLDEDEIFQSDYLQLNSESLEQLNQYDYKVSINTVHNYIMNKDEQIQKVLKESSHSGDSLFNISLVIYENSKEFVIGNAQLPIEDLVDLIDQQQTTNSKQTLTRVVFIYGTTFSQRENCIIGKMQLEINYNTEKQFLTNNAIEEELLYPEEDNQACFLHRETFIKRKIPLNAVISIDIERINNLKESLENIEHFSKIQQSAMRETQDNNHTSKMSGTTKSFKNQQILQSKEQVDRRRILTQIFKQGLNLSVIGSIFDEDTDLKKKFTNSKYTTQLLYNTLNPIFNESFEIGVQMDTQIFEYVKNKKALFEIRHYLISSKKTNKEDSGLSMFLRNKEERIETERTDNTQGDDMQQSDYIVIGYVKVPLLHLITKNNGIDGDFVIFDDYKQQMGSLKLRISLNHHSNKRPLYSETNKVNNKIENQGEQKVTMLEKSIIQTQTFARTGSALLQNQSKHILCLNFYELIFKNRQQFIQQMQISGNSNQQSFLYLKFRIQGQSFQTKFISSQYQNQQQALKDLGIIVFDIKKSILVELDFLKQKEIEETFSKPLEIQLWFKKENIHKYQQPEKEQLLGSFFIELNELQRVRNKRVKDQNGNFQSYEGYFTLYDYEREQVVSDRLGCKIYLVKKGNIQLRINHNFIEYDNQIGDLEVLLHNLKEIENHITSQLDPQQKGYADLDDILQKIDSQLQDPYQSLLKEMVSQLSYKNADKVYYSSIFGQLPPFFRYARRFDSFGIIEKFNKELLSIDTHSNGLVPVGLFRSILEHELKIKERIVQDFIENLKESNGNDKNVQSLDVNIFSHSFKNHIDYVVLLRKIAHTFELKNFDNNESLIVKNQSILDDEVILKIDIESALRVKNPINELEPPNTFVEINFPINGCSPNTLKSQTIIKSSYPQWHQIGQTIKFRLSNETLKQIIDNPLEFQVYHQQLANKDNVKNHLIGVAYVDLSQMVFVEGVYQIGGYFHIVRKDKFKDCMTLTLADPHRISMESLGQIKLGITTNTNLKRATYSNVEQKTIVKENSPLKNREQDQYRAFDKQDQNKQNQTNVYNMSFARDSFNHNHLFSEHLKYSNYNLELSLTKKGMELEDKHEIDLKQTLSQQMSELDELNRKLLRSSQNKDLDFDNQHEEHKQNSYEDPYANGGFATTIGYNKSADLQNSFQPFAYKNNNPVNIKFDMPRVNIIQELQEDNESMDLNQEDSLRRDNVFENNISQSSKKELSDYGEEQPEPQYLQRQQFTNEEQKVQNFQEQQLQQQIDEFPIKETLNTNNNPNIFDHNFLIDDQTREEEQQQQRQVQTEAKKNPRFDYDNDDYDEKELERIEKILKSQRK